MKSSSIYTLLILAIVPCNLFAFPLQQAAVGAAHVFCFATSEDEKTLFCSFNGQGIWGSIDGGLNLQNWFYLNGYQLAYSSDAGLNWDSIPLSSDLLNQFGLYHAISYDADANRIWLDSDFGPLWCNYQAVNVDEQSPTSLPIHITLHPPRPNPFNGTSIINFSLNRSGPARMALFDVLGRQLKTMMTESLPAGDHQLALDASELPSGNYFIRLDVAGQSVQQRITLVK